VLTVRNPLVHLVWSPPLITIAYQLSLLALHLSCETFTNHYHRTGGQGIDLAVEGSVVVGASVVATWAVW